MERITCPFGKPGDWLQIVEAPALVLRISHLRAEPVRAITEAEALAEGIVAHPPFPGEDQSTGPQFAVRGEPTGSRLQPSAVAAFTQLLDSIYPTAWARNEWVWVVEFQCIPG